MTSSRSFSKKEFKELDHAARAHPDAHIRSRAIAVRAVALGFTRQQVAEFFPMTPYSIGQAVLHYQDNGLDGLGIAPGRGRKSTVDEQEVLSYLRQSPEHFGYERNRWTLSLLAEACPSLRGMGNRGVLKVINRLGFRYKRGQQWIHSPDPQYEEKKTPSNRPTKRRAKRRRS